MPKLKCSAVHCEYNSDNHCCLPDIRVGGGHEAKSASETCCDSFLEKGHNAVNRADYCHPDNTLRVDCTATSCVYNESGVCEAKAIQIGNNRACCRTETLCDTFSCSSHSCGCR